MSTDLIATVLRQHRTVDAGRRVPGNRQRRHTRARTRCHGGGRVTVNAECAWCGVTAADLPYEELELELEQASELLFTTVGHECVCDGCAQIAGEGA